ncbi:MAG: hypothetical protein IKZ22_04210, partial [Kiritimatiellae bacterium]|nr:hypothetical protein [Kiritimatiellia bacterium]
MGMTIKYNREFFDRDYSVREAYGRVWKYARRYRFRLFMGVICGMLTAGTLVPFFQIVQPTLRHVESHDAAVSSAAGEVVARDASGSVPAEGRPRNVYEKRISRNSKLPSWYPQVEKFAAKLGITLQNEKGGMGGALLLIVCLVVPAVALVRLTLMFLNHYCLSWAGAPP